MKKITLLGSTGSIGLNTLKIISQFDDRFKVVALAARRDTGRLKRQIAKFSPKLVAVHDENAAQKLRAAINTRRTKVMSGEEGVNEVAAYSGSDLVVSAIVGSAGLLPTISAIEAKKDIALANKETMVMAGELIMKLAKKNGVNIYPVDSEHSAIFQSMMGHKKSGIRKIILTASGGAFVDKTLTQLKNVSVKDALAHPNWKMGEKVTIDSATMMNKGLEVIEAHYLFGIAPKDIEVVIHKQSIVHSMVEYKDGSVIAQMGVPDMRTPIAFALSYPERIPVKLKRLDLTKVKSLTFKKPDMKKYTALGLAYDAIKKGGVTPTVLNSADEVAVEHFLRNRIKFLDIPKVIKKTMTKVKIDGKINLNKILSAKKEAEREAKKIIDKGVF
jgi:1-deoxy-D-xylulose-5-phosphate reductoisomerase